MTPWTLACQAPPGKNTGVGCHSLLQEIFPTQPSNTLSRITDRLFTNYTTGEGMVTVWGDSTMIRYSFVDNDSVYIPKDTIVNPALHDTVEILLEKAL